MKCSITICLVTIFLIATNNLYANTTESSTMWFQGSLTDAGGGVYTGILNMVNEAALGIGDGIAGFDVYAKEGGTAYVQGMTPDNWIISSSHDAYGAPGPWGAWFDPDCADWDQYSLELTANHWYLRYASTWESPMSGAMNWVTMVASETDLGTQDRPQVRSDGNPPSPLHGGHGGSAAQGGGAGAWDWDCGWGVEVVPLEYSSFKVAITPSGSYTVSLTPVPAPGAILLGGLGVGLVGWLRRRRTL